MQFCSIRVSRALRWLQPPAARALHLSETLLPTAKSNSDYWNCCFSVCRDKNFILIGALKMLREDSTSFKCLLRWVQRVSCDLRTWDEAVIIEVDEHCGGGSDWKFIEVLANWIIHWAVWLTIWSAGTLLIEKFKFGWVYSYLKFTLFFGDHLIVLFKTFRLKLSSS